MEKLRGIDRRKEIRELGLEVFLKVDLQERDKIKGVEFEVPSFLGDFTEEDGRAVADAIHGFRFAGEEDTEEARRASQNYFLAVLKTVDGKTLVAVSFSRQAWERKKREIGEGIYKRFLIRQLLFTSS